MTNVSCQATDRNPEIVVLFLDLIGSKHTCTLGPFLLLLPAHTIFKLLHHPLIIFFSIVLMILLYLLNPHHGVITDFLLNVQLITNTVVNHVFTLNGALLLLVSSSDEGRYLVEVVLLVLFFIISYLFEQSVL